MTVIDVEGVSNVRDVGGISTSDGRRIRARVLLRSGQLSGATAAGADELRSRVSCIVDLRDDQEVAAEPTGITGVRTVHLPMLTGSLQSFAAPDITIDALYTHLIEESGDRIVEAIRLIASRESTLVHCTMGKDRTGVTVALALSAVGADREAVIADYALTESQLPRERTAQIAAMLEKMFPGASNLLVLATKSPAEAMRRLLERVDAEWGSAAGYLRAQGMTDAELAALDAALVE